MKLLDTLAEAIYYDEIAIGFTRMQTECKDFIASLKQQGVDMDQIIQPGYVTIWKKTKKLEDVHILPLIARLHSSIHVLMFCTPISGCSGSYIGFNVGFMSCPVLSVLILSFPKFLIIACISLKKFLNIQKHKSFREGLHRAVFTYNFYLDSWLKT